jgi:type II secretory pathway component PulF
VSKLDDILYNFSKSSYKGNLKAHMRLYRKLSGMLNMNESLPRSLERLWVVASFNGKNPKAAEAVALKEWREGLQSGRNLSEAMEGWVAERHLMLIRAGEESGALARGFESIEFIEKSSARMSKAIMGAINYPVFIFILLFGVLWMFGLNLVGPMRKYAPPSIKEKIHDLGAVTDFVQDDGLYIFVFVGILVFVVIQSLPRWVGPIRVQFDKYPPYSWYRLWTGSAFLMSLSALLAAQTPLSRALTILESRASPWLRQRIFGARQEVMRGKNLGEALQADNYGFPDDAIIMDMIILSERADVATILDMVSREWLDEQILLLEAQSGVVRSFGMALVGGVIGWAFSSILGIAQGTADTTGSGGMK